MESNAMKGTGMADPNEQANAMKGTSVADPINRL